VRPAETNWHMVIVRLGRSTRLMLVGPWSRSGTVGWGEGAEILWIRFKLGVFMPHRPTRTFLDQESPLPDAAGRRFWLDSAAWQFPDFENADTFAERLARQEILARDALIADALRGHTPDIAPRTLRHRFLRATGQTQGHILQFNRAREAERLLLQGKSILDTVYETGYYDQPHLTRSLKQFIGRTPGQLLGAV
jgi:hypothetical protein